MSGLSVKSVFVLAAAAALAGAGCSIAPPVEMRDDPEMVALGARAKAARPLPRLAMTPVQTMYATSFDLEKEPGRIPAVYDRIAFSAALREDLGTYTGFGAPVDVGDPDLNAGTSDRDVAKALRPLFRAAAEKNAELLLVPRLTKFDVFFDRRDGVWIWNAMIWLYFWIPAWWVRDEVYGAQARLELDIYSVASERRVYHAGVDGAAEKSLDDFDRGWDFLGIFRVPGSLDQDQMKRVNDVLHPHALRELERQVCFELGDRFPAALDAGDTDYTRDAAVHALLVGVSKYEHPELIDGPDGAAHDVADVKALLAERYGVPEKNFVLAPSTGGERRALIDQRATNDQIRVAIESSFEGLRKQVRPKDTVVFYFSGCGTTGPAASGDGRDAYLLPYDVNLHDLPKTAIPLRWLCAKLRELRPARVIVIADAAFGPHAGGMRSLKGPAASESPPPLSIFEAASRGSIPTALIIAAGGAESAPLGEDALDLVEARRGLFTAILVDGARGRADRDLSGEVSLGELGAYVAPQVKAQAGLEGVTQVPAVFERGARVPTDRAAGGPSWVPVIRR